MAEMDPNRYDYREVACPHCHAAAGSYCIRPSGHSGPIVAAHKPRRAAAHTVWREEEIQKYGKQITPWDDDPRPEAAPVPATDKMPAAPVQLCLFAAVDSPIRNAA